MKISVIGSGYVGLVTGACLADIGNHVVCLDIDTQKIACLIQGDIPIYEPGLKEIISRNMISGRIRFTSDAKMSAEHGDVQFIAVGTPSGEDGSADLSYVLAAARAIGQYMNKPITIVNKSTVPVGTVDRVHTVITDELQKRQVKLHFSVASNPEFLKEGSAITDFSKPDRIIIGCSDAHAIETLKAVYAPLLRNHDRLIVMDARSAELTKYAANAMLATRISFMNEIANLADRVGADVEAVRKGIGSDSRIGYSFLYAGPGYGGSCFPKDVKALVQTGQEYQQAMTIVSAVEAVNEQQKIVMVDKIKEHFGSSLQGKRLALWGLAFKPNTDDMREAPSLSIIAALAKEGVNIQAYDPIASVQARRVLGPIPQLIYADSPDQACEGADALIIVTEWRQFHSPDFDQLKALLKAPLIFDCRNLFDPQRMAQQGFAYYTIGRGPHTHHSTTHA
jgi:UDPglucose 6-dehydrogenase